MSQPPPPAPAQVAQAPLQEGTVYALLPLPLLECIQRAAPPPLPHPCDVSSSLRDPARPSSLRRGAAAGEDFDYLPLEAFQAYAALHGGALAGEALARHCVAAADGALTVDHHPQEVCVTVAGGSGGGGAAARVAACREWQPARLLQALAAAAQGAGLLPAGQPLHSLRMWLLPPPPPSCSPLPLPPLLLPPAAPTSALAADGGSGADDAAMGGAAGGAVAAAPASPPPPPPPPPPPQRTLLAGRRLQAFLEEPGRQQELALGESSVELEVRLPSGLWPSGDATLAVRSHFAQVAALAASAGAHGALQLKDPLLGMWELDETRGSEHLVETLVVRAFPTAERPMGSWRTWQGCHAYSIAPFECKTVPLADVKLVYPLLSRSLGARALEAGAAGRGYGLSAWRSCLRVGDALAASVADSASAPRTWRLAWVTDICHASYPPLLTLDVLMQRRPARWVKGYACGLESEAVSCLEGKVRHLSAAFLTGTQHAALVEQVREAETLRPRWVPPPPADAGSDAQRAALRTTVPALAEGALPGIKPGDLAAPPAPDSSATNPLLHLTVEELNEEVEGHRTGLNWGWGGGAQLGRAGVVGLRNLGNTCFMNSILQCLAAVEPLSSYFLRAPHGPLAELNRANKLGSGGRLAMAWMAFLRCQRSGAKPTLSPGVIKDFVSEKAPWFIGYNQHDSEDFLRTMLDWLLEDTCRVRHAKPSVADAPELRAPEAWANHLRRNDSPVTDIFFGQFRSQLTCLTCGTMSTKFDPFSSLALALVEEAKWESRTVYLMAPPGASRVPEQLKLWYCRRLTGPLTVAQLCVCVERLRVAGEAGGSWGGSSSGGSSSSSSSGGSSSAPFGTSAQNPFQITPEIAADARAWCEGRMADMATPSALSLRAFSNVYVDRERYWLTEDLSATPQRIAPFVSMGTGFDRFVFLYPTAAAGHFDSGSSSSGSATTPGATSSSIQQPPAAPPSTSTPPVPPPPPYLPYLTVTLLNAEREASIDFAMQMDGGAGALHVGDALVLPLPASPAAPRPSNAAIHEAAWAAYARFVPEHQRPSFSAREPPYALFVTAPLPRIHQADALLRASQDRFAARAPQPVPFDQAPFLYHGGSCSLTLLTTPDRVRLQKPVISRSRSVDLPPPPLPQGAAGSGLDDCLRHFSQPERLCLEEQVLCAVCKVKRDTEKVMQIWKAPPVLTVHLKRFRTRGVPGALEIVGKITTCVDFPVGGSSGAPLDLSPFVAGPPEEQALPLMLGGGGGGGAGGAQALLYDLVAVSEHCGSLHSGHYTARFKEHASGQWWFANDESCHECEPGDAVSEDAYVLFYQRRDSRVHEGTDGSSSSSGGGSGGGSSSSSSSGAAAATP